MGITDARASRHIAEWESRLSVGAHTHRSRWPSRLFHHSPIENTARILTDGYLLSRHGSTTHRKLDVADTSVIQHRDTAHQFARLYFRPRTPTQFHIEGVRKQGDYYNGDPSAHAPTLVMLIFDSRTILTRDGVRFSTGNMQSFDAMHGDTDEFFDTIEFMKVYHEGGKGGDRSITHCRCAEVLAPSPMLIADSLTSIYCRSAAERMTLLHELRAASEIWKDRIFVSDDLRVFEKRFVFVESVSLQHDGVVFQLHPSAYPVAVQIEVWTETGAQFAEFSWSAMSAVPNTGNAWRAPVVLANGVYIVRIALEGCRAFEARLLVEDVPF
jgi:hypothetical protein